MTPETRVPLWMADLERENRVGVPHFKTGQIRAWTDEPLGLLRFVDSMGYAWLVCLDRSSGEWEADLAIRVSANGLSAGWQDPPRAFRVTPALQAALDTGEPFE